MKPNLNTWNTREKDKSCLEVFETAKESFSSIIFSFFVTIGILITTLTQELKVVVVVLVPKCYYFLSENVRLSRRKRFLKITDKIEDYRDK